MTSLEQGLSSSEARSGKSLGTRLVETLSEVCEDEVSAPVEKCPRTELLDIDELSDLEASQTTSGSEVDEDDFEDILGQLENVNIVQAQKILTSQQKTASSTAAIPGQEIFRSYLQTTDQRSQD